MYRLIRLSGLTSERTLSLRCESIIKLPFTSSCVLNYKAYLLGNKYKVFVEDIDFGKYIQDQTYMSALIKKWGVVMKKGL